MGIADSLSRCTSKILVNLQVEIGLLVTQKGMLIN